MISTLSTLLVMLSALAGAPPSAHPWAGPPNRLLQESSPYLQLHAHNPVDWYPWGEEALERARREGKPIFLSVGYSTCHWCHVMERRVFSDPTIAALMNRWFVNVKVDREERPDLDEIYMTSTQLLTGRGGWPNSVFLTPALEPFFAGTYFPPRDEGGLPGFGRVLESLHQAWTERRPDVEAQARRVAAAVRAALSERRELVTDRPPATTAAAAVAGLERRFDRRFGGFGEGPKFPSPGSLLLLWAEAEQGDAGAREMVLATLRGMGRGAIYDQLGGGFHRYTLDRAWRIPHFEKMLYDNALLAEILVVTSVATADPELMRLARGTLEFLLEVMRLPGGAFKSAIDAETEGVEGAYYVWSWREIAAVLGEADARWLAPILGLDGPPNFEGERHTLYLTDSLAGHAERLGTSLSSLMSRLEPLLTKLEERRAQRAFPRVDDKVLTDWNGLAISAFARAGQLLRQPRYTKAAILAAEFVLEMRDEQGYQLHVWRDDRAKVAAFLDDYSYLVRGLLDLFETTGEQRWLTAAQGLSEEMEERLRSPGGGYFTAAADPTLLVRARTASEGARPPGNAIAILNLLRLEQLTGTAAYRARALSAVTAFAAELDESPETIPTLALAARRLGDLERTTPTPTLAEEIVTAVLRPGRAEATAPWRPFTVELEIREGWHINANPASLDFLIPTSLEGEVRRLVYPEGERVRLGFADEKLRVYRGRAVVSGEVQASAQPLRLVYQACDDRRCLPPVQRELPWP